MTITIVPNAKGNPPGKLADVELHFTDGPLEGLKLVGFAVWERKTTSASIAASRMLARHAGQQAADAALAASRRNVTFPSRQFSVNGERRSYAQLRPITEDSTLYAQPTERLRDLILQAYAEHEAEAVTVCGGSAGLI